MASETDPLTTTICEAQTETSQASTYAKDQVVALAHMITDGTTSIRTLALLGGIAMTITSAMGIWHRFFAFNWISAIVEFYTFLLGLTIIVLESRSGNFEILQRRYTDGCDAQIRKYALFLSFISGRGGLYFVAGTLQLSQLSFIDLVVGGYMATVGIAYIIVGKRTSHKLRFMRKTALSEDLLRKKFSDADTVRNGYLTVEQFKNMLSTEFGIEFTSRELEASLNGIESVRKRDEKVTLDQFLEWWSTCEFDDANMAEFGFSV